MRAVPRTTLLRSFQDSNQLQCLSCEAGAASKHEGMQVPNRLASAEQVPPVAEQCPLLMQAPACSMVYDQDHDTAGLCRAGMTSLW